MTSMAWISSDGAMMQQEEISGAVGCCVEKATKDLGFSNRDGEPKQFFGNQEEDNGDEDMDGLGPRSTFFRQRPPQALLAGSHKEPPPPPIRNPRSRYVSHHPITIAPPKRLPRHLCLSGG
ncbi:hypothetical protein L1887_14012 [Cichorium endivia]|nr:hypothetical protein L1887_14012 [Cichorium endivia]